MSARVWAPVPESMNWRVTSYWPAYSELVLKSLTRASKISRTLSEPVAQRLTAFFPPDPASPELPESPALPPQPVRQAASMTAERIMVSSLLFISVISFQVCARIWDEKGIPPDKRAQLRMGR